MKILIQKFGGTSVSTSKRRELVIEKVKKAKSLGYFPVVVVSAMGRKGDHYATDTLLSLVDENFISNNPQAGDLLMSCGETISTAVMCYDFNKAGIKAMPLTGGQAGIITDSNYGNANLLRVEKENIMDLIHNGIVPIVAGFQGKDCNGYITTLGRGGSDVSAAILGVALNAEEIEIYTDVDGIMTADPRIVSDASLLSEISYNEVFQFAEQGAKVIHPRAVEIAMKSNIPLVIKNTLNDTDGTVISCEHQVPNDRIITGITHMANRVQVKISSLENSGNQYYADILEILADNNISIDLINVFPDSKIFTIDARDLNKFIDIMNRQNIKYSYIENCSKIALIGSRMRGVPGVMAKILKVLEKNNISVHQTADSHNTIWCLIDSSNTEKAINALHKEFHLGI